VRLGPAVERVARSERELAARLERVGDRHRAEHDVFHLTATLAQMSSDRAQRLAAWAEFRRIPLDLGTPSADGAEANGQPDLLADLRELYLATAAASIDWTVLGQAAQAARDSELLALVSDCHPDTLRQLKWATSRLKQAAPQALSR
jgi:hypothetical protein